MRIDREVRPIIQLLLDDPSRRLRHKTKRISREVDQRSAIFAGRQMKLVAELTRRIFVIELARIFFVGRKNSWT